MKYDKSPSANGNQETNVPQPANADAATLNLNPASTTTPQPQEQQMTDENKQPASAASASGNPPREGAPPSRLTRSARRAARKRRDLQISPALLIRVFERSRTTGLVPSTEDLYRLLNRLYLDAEGGLSPSQIEWTGFGWNFVVGCTTCSPGCHLCYARRLHNQRYTAYQRYNGIYPSTGHSMPEQYAKPFDVVQIIEKRLGKPLRTKAPGYAFVNAFSDLLHEKVPLDVIQKAFIVMGACPHIQFQILTKRAERLADIAHLLPWFPNIWMGVSVENSDFLYRVDLLRKVPAAVRWVSAEPLIGSIGGINLNEIHWLVAGGETGASHQTIRPAHADWYRDLRDRCAESGVSFFFKQTGDGVHSTQLIDTGLEGKTTGRKIISRPLKKF